MKASTFQTVLIKMMNERLFSKIRSPKINAPSPRFWILTVGFFLLFYAVLQIGLKSGYRLGFDPQKLFGLPSCSDDIVYFMALKPNIVPKRGDYIVAAMPEHDLNMGPPNGRLIVKRVVAGPGDSVKIEGTELYINGLHRDRLWLAKSIPKKQPGDFDISITLASGQYFLMGTTQESFDSRYWGPVSEDSIRGYAYPLF